MPDPMWQQLSEEDSASIQGNDGQDGEELMESSEEEWQVFWQMHSGESSSSSGYEWIAIWQIQGDNSSSQEGEELAEEESSGQEEEALQEKILAVVKFLLLKYRSKEIATKKEIIRNFLRHYPALFPIIFNHSCEYLQLVFGIDVQEVVPHRSFQMVPCLGLTYDGLEDPEQIMPKTGLLVIVLGIIFLAGNCIKEEDLWNVLSLMGVYPDIEHHIFGHPRELLTNVWVQEQYVEYRYIPGNYPGRHQFLWGPRAYGETSKQEVLKFLLKMSESDPEASDESSESDGEEGA
ncbi:melanoma-associated antigen 10-like [Sorex araneus]|uniref:melanoma-associated antigen 10-like n=1 Tax=Sorex araneus TaxID=42254 RepID=UPI00033161A9|nr:melanoma-associated antigen 10-like [Sorex araneus]